MKLLFALFGVSLCCVAAPVSSDLWEYTQPSFSIISSSLDSICGSPSNMFGNTALAPTDIFSTCGLEAANGNVVLSSIGPTTIEWNTALMNLTSFELNLLPDSGASRFLSRLQLASWNGSSYDSFYDSGANGFTLGVTTFPVTLVSPVQASRWQAVFTNRTEDFVGARIVELDGFGSLATSSNVPEPSSVGLAMSGLAALALAARRKSRK